MGGNRRPDPARRAALLLAGAGLAAALLLPACGGGGGSGGGTAGAPQIPGGLPGTSYPPLPLVDTSSPTHTITLLSSATGGPAQTALQNALSAGGVIVFETGGADVTLTLTATLSIPDANPGIDAVLDGRGRVTLSGAGTRRILHKGWQSNLTLQRLRFVNARATDSGAAVNMTTWEGRLTLIDCHFDNCRTTGTGPDIGGGAVRVLGQRHFRVSQCTFTGCWGSNGGAINSLGSQLTIIESSFTSCRAYGTGGGTDRGPTGQGGIGGAVYVDGVSQNGDEPRLVLSGCVFSVNTANDHAGAVFGYTVPGVVSATFIDATTFSGNTVTDPAGLGFAGALYSQNGTLTLANSTFSGNSTRQSGGGLWLTTPHAALVANCTLHNNLSLGFGGAMTLLDGSVSLANVTISGNGAGAWGGGIWSAVDTVTVTNTILSQNTGSDPNNGHNTNRTFPGGGWNLQWPATRPGGAPDTPVTVGVTFADPALGPLGVQGGPTATMAVPAGSPGVDAGLAPGAPPLDQRGFGRAGPPDVGAYERQ